MDDDKNDLDKRLKQLIVKLEAQCPPQQSYLLDLIKILDLKRQRKEEQIQKLEKERVERDILEEIEESVDSNNFSIKRKVAEEDESAVVTKKPKLEASSNTNVDRVKSSLKPIKLKRLKIVTNNDFDKMRSSFERSMSHQISITEETEKRAAELEKKIEDQNRIIDHNLNDSKLDKILQDVNTKATNEVTLDKHKINFWQELLNDRSAECMEKMKEKEVECKEKLEEKESECEAKLQQKDSIISTTNQELKNVKKSLKSERDVLAKLKTRIESCEAENNCLAEKLTKCDNERVLSEERHKSEMEILSQKYVSATKLVQSLKSHNPGSIDLSTQQTFPDTPNTGLNTSDDDELENNIETLEKSLQEWKTKYEEIKEEYKISQEHCEHFATLAMKYKKKIVSEKNNGE